MRWDRARDEADDAEQSRCSGAERSYAKHLEAGWHIHIAEDDSCRREQRYTTCHEQEQPWLHQMELIEFRLRIVSHDSLAHAGVAQGREALLERSRQSDARCELLVTCRSQQRLLLVLDVRHRGILEVGLWCAGESYSVHRACGKQWFSERVGVATVHSPHARRRRWLVEDPAKDGFRIVAGDASADFWDSGLFASM